MPAPSNNDDSFVQIPKKLIPYIIGVMLGGGGTFSVNAIAGESALSDADLAKIEVIVNKAVNASAEMAKLQFRIELQDAIKKHEQELHKEPRP